MSYYIHNIYKISILQSYEIYNNCKTIYQNASLQNYKSKHKHDKNWFYKLQYFPSRYFQVKFNYVDPYMRSCGVIMAVLKHLVVQLLKTFLVSTTKNVFQYEKNKTKSVHQNSAI